MYILYVERQINTYLVKLPEESFCLLNFILIWVVFASYLLFSIERSVGDFSTTVKQYIRHQEQAGNLKIFCTINLKFLPLFCTFNLKFLPLILFVCLIALCPWSIAKDMLGRSFILTTLLLGKPPRGRLPGPEVMKLFSCSAQLRLKFILLINVVGILTFISRVNYMLW